MTTPGNPRNLQPLPFDLAPVSDGPTGSDPWAPNHGNPRVGTSPFNGKHHIRANVKDAWFPAAEGSEAQSIVDAQPKAKTGPSYFDLARTTLKPGAQSAEPEEEPSVPQIESRVSETAPKKTEIAEKASRVAVASTIEQNSDPAKQAGSKPPEKESDQGKENLFQEIRSSDITADQEVIDPKDRPVFLLARDTNVIPGSRGIGNSLLYSDPSKSNPHGDYYLPGADVFLPPAVSSLINDREFGRSGRIPPFNSEKGNYDTDKGEKIKYSGSAAPTLVQLHHPEAGSYSLLSLGIDISHDLRGFFCFAAEGNQTPEQMFERAKAAYPELFDASINTARHLGGAAMPIDKVKSIVGQIAEAKNRVPEVMSITIAPGDAQEAAPLSDELDENAFEQIRSLAEKFAKEQTEAAITEDRERTMQRNGAGILRRSSVWEAMRGVESKAAAKQLDELLEAQKPNVLKPLQDQDNFDRIVSALYSDIKGRPEASYDKSVDSAALNLGSELKELLDSKKLKDPDVIDKAADTIRLLSTAGLYKLMKWQNAAQIKTATMLIEAFAANLDFDIESADYEYTKAMLVRAAAVLELDLATKPDYQSDRPEMALRNADIHECLDALNRAHSYIIARNFQKK